MHSGAPVAGFGRPYEKAEGVSVGADFISARAPHPRRTHSVGADAHIGPLGTGIKSTIAERVPTASGTIEPGGTQELVPGGHTDRPYEKTDSGSVGDAFIAGPAVVEPLVVKCRGLWYNEGKQRRNRHARLPVLQDYRRGDPQQQGL